MAIPMIPIVARGIMSLAGRMIARNPRLGKNLLRLFNKSKDKGITLYRGELAKTMPKHEAAKALYSADSVFPWTHPNLRSQAIGRWFTSDPTYAKNFAGSSRFLSMFKNPRDVLNWGGGYRPGVVKKVTLSAKEAKLANRVMNKIHGTKDLDYAYVISKKALKRAETDKLKTFIANFYRMIGKKKGGLAQILNV